MAQKSITTSVQGGDLALLVLLHLLLHLNVESLPARGQCYKTFFVRDLPIFILSQSVCYTQLEKFTKDKHSSLLLKSVIYVQKKFYNIGPRPRLHHRPTTKNSKLLFKQVTTSSSCLNSPISLGLGPKNRPCLSVLRRICCVCWPQSLGGS